MSPTLILAASTIFLLAASPCMAQPADTPKVFVHLGHSEEITSVAFSPDGRTVLSGSQDNTLKLWDVATGQEIRTFNGHSGDVNSVAFSPDGRTVLSGSKDYTLKLWDAATGREIRTFTRNAELTVSSFATSVAYSPDGQTVVSGSDDNAVTLWEVRSGRQILTFAAHERPLRVTWTSPDGRGGGVDHSNTVCAVAFSPDRKSILSGCGDWTLQLCDAVTGREIRNFTGHSDAVKSVCFSPDGRTIVSGSSDNTLKLWDVTTGREIRTFTGHSGEVNSVAFSPDGRTILSGSNDETLRLWDASTSRAIRTFTGHTKKVSAVAFSPDGTAVLSGSWDKSLKLWDVATGRLVRTFAGHANGGRVAVSARDHVALLRSSGSTLKLWDVATGQEIRTFRGHLGRVNSIAFSPDGRTVLSGGADSTLKLWDAATGQEIHTFRGHSGPVYSVAFSPDGLAAASAGDDSLVRLWDVATGREIRTFSGHKGWISAVTFSPDGRTILSGGSDRTMRLWDTSTGHEIREFTSSLDWFMSVAFSRDGLTVLSGSMRIGGRETLKLWDVTTGREIRTFSGHSDWVNSVAFSPDGHTVLSGYRGGTLELSDVSTGREIRTFVGHTNNVLSVAFMFDGRTVSSASLDGTVRLWNVETGKEIAKLVSFDNDEWVAITPEGYYASSAAGDQFLNVRIGSDVYGIDQWREQFYRPDIVKKSLELGDSRRAMEEVLACAGVCPTIENSSRPPQITIQFPQNGQHMQNADTVLVLRVEDPTNTIRAVQVFLNGKPVTEQTAKGFGELEASGINLSIPQGKHILDLSVPVTLEPGQNEIVVRAIGAAEGRDTLTVYAPRVGPESNLPKPDLWILAIGVNHYADSSHLRWLQWSESDAQGMIGVFQAQEGKRYRHVYPRLVSDNGDVEPTREKILESLIFLRKAGPNDVAVLFLSGHGMTDPRGSFWFLSSDTRVKGGTIDTATAVSSAAINHALDFSARRFVFIDACHSGGLHVDNDQLFMDLSRSHPAILFASSTGTQSSWELNEFRHSAFTYALLANRSILCM